MRNFLTAWLWLLTAATSVAQESGAGASWFWKEKLEIRTNYRDSHEERFPLKFPFPAGFLPVGQTVGFEQTVDGGHHLELSVVDLHLDLGYGKNFLAHAKLRGVDLYKQNPTSTDRKFDADELYLRFGQKPEVLARPLRTTLFFQIGKAPKMERQPVRLLESYGLASTAFNRLEDVQAMAGGTFGRNVYWRFQASNGNPMFFRDTNALAGDNGIPELLEKNPDPRYKSGFPILYNAKVTSLALKGDHLQLGQGVGYRWQRDDESAGLDILLFHYKRTMADHVTLFGTFYGGDLDLLTDPFNNGPPFVGRNKEETGGRLFAEWGGLTANAQFTKQDIAGLHRQGWELETGYEFRFHRQPAAGSGLLFPSIQPALRLSGLENRFRGPDVFVAPSIWWNWIKFDYGVRIGLTKYSDITVERAKHNVTAPRKLNLDETLVTWRIRV